jgi:hypothetical protein
LTTRVAMWSGPRNISTAMMRSFSSRADCAVTDEPFYGCFLKASGEPHPMADEVVAAMDCDWQSVARAMRGPVPDGKVIWYQKHMPHNMIGPINILDFPDHVHAFLIRAPELVVASYTAKHHLHDARLLGFAQLVDYHKRISDRVGVAAPVVDSNDILADPARVLKKLCAALGIAWDPAMLGWVPGPHSADGIWGTHWYNAVERSSAFGPPTPPVQLEGEARRVADQCQPDYDYLRGHCISR